MKSLEMKGVAVDDVLAEAIESAESLPFGFPAKRSMARVFVHGFQGTPIL